MYVNSGHNHYDANGNITKFFFTYNSIDIIWFLSYQRQHQRRFIATNATHNQTFTLYRRQAHHRQQCQKNNRPKST